MQQLLWQSISQSVFPLSNKLFSFTATCFCSSSTTITTVSIFFCLSGRLSSVTTDCLSASRSRGCGHSLLHISTRFSEHGRSHSFQFHPSIPFVRSHHTLLRTPSCIRRARAVCCSCPCSVSLSPLSPQSQPAVRAVVSQRTKLHAVVGEKNKRKEKKRNETELWPKRRLDINSKKTNHTQSVWMSVRLSASLPACLLRENICPTVIFCFFIFFYPPLMGPGVSKAIARWIDERERERKRESIKKIRLPPLLSYPLGVKLIAIAPDRHFHNFITSQSVDQQFHTI